MIGAGGGRAGRKSRAGGRVGAPEAVPVAVPVSRAVPVARAVMRPPKEMLARLRRRDGMGVLGGAVGEVGGCSHRRSPWGVDVRPQLRDNERTMVCGKVIVFVFGGPFR